MLRPKYFWLKFIGVNWYSSVIILAVLVASAKSLIHGDSTHFGPAIAVLLVFGGFIAFSWYQYSSKISKAFETQNASRASLSLETDGVHTTLTSGATAFIPWSSYTGWSEGKSIFLLKGSNGATILPCDELNRSDVRTFLNTKIS